MKPLRFVKIAFLAMSIVGSNAFGCAGESKEYEVSFDNTPNPGIFAVNLKNGNETETIVDAGGFVASRVLLSYLVKKPNSPNQEETRKFFATQVDLTLAKVEEGRASYPDQVSAELVAAAKAYRDEAHKEGSSFNAKSTQAAYLKVQSLLHGLDFTVHTSKDNFASDHQKDSLAKLNPTLPDPADDGSVSYRGCSNEIKNLKLFAAPAPAVAKPAALPKPFTIR